MIRMANLGRFRNDRYGWIAARLLSGGRGPKRTSSALDLRGSPPKFLPDGRRVRHRVGVRRVEVDAGRHDGVDPVQDVPGEHHVSAAQQSVELLHRARSDDRCGHRRMSPNEGDVPPSLWSGVSASFPVV